MECKDVHCPHHGSLRLRRRAWIGRVVSTKAKKTATIVIPRVVRVPKYERFERRKTKLHAHVPPCVSVKEGDLVEVVECRKLSKLKASVVTRVVGE